MKFYYDPNNKKLEPIAFDGNVQQNNRYLFHGENSTILRDAFNYMLLKDSVFVQAYREKMLQYSDSIFFKNELQQIQPQIEIYKNTIASDNPRFSFDMNYIFNRVKAFQKRIALLNLYEYVNPADPVVYHESYIDLLKKCDSLLVKSLIKIDSTGIKSYYHKEAMYEYKGLQYSLPAYNFIGYPKIVPFKKTEK